MITRRLLNAVSRLHSARLVALLDKTQRAEDRQADQVEIAERFSRWANEVKKQQRQKYQDAVHHTEVVAGAVRAELQALPAITSRAEEVEW